MASSGLELLWVSAPQLITGAGRTLGISLLAIVFSSIGGVGYGVLRSLGKRWLEVPLRIYLELFRAIPVLVWLYLFFFGLPIFLGVSIPALLVRSAGAFFVGGQRGR
ncbi:Amino acid ABC transporter membrane protein 2, PAAT family [Pseudomonas syringae pv. solidagae]|uniref:Amino acid ABC transporter membrane protein 2 n=1 Tax=Pseudomonas syringae pv. solidagae TaxID=264458 RepID=A0A0P9ZM40_PSESX|nr:Amino acid ABC transporter membrane protein 2, PAAT family [Pseudomonas syringae pv. solidagae]RMT35209.1 Amino acid ABC transporter membrane protein 2 [Pseudomonas syringae pv. solidagae]RMT49417.1 Amino acid ABC transporter membrane protein 2 [Pseudomonas syringae pv. solidagae]